MKILSLTRNVTSVNPPHPPHASQTGAADACRVKSVPNRRREPIQPLKSTAAHEEISDLKSQINVCPRLYMSAKAFGFLGAIHEVNFQDGCL